MQSFHKWRLYVTVQVCVCVCNVFSAFIAIFDNCLVFSFRMDLSFGLLYRHSCCVKCVMKSRNIDFFKRKR